MHTDRVLSSVEERWLNDEQKAYLRKNINAYCLDQDRLPCYALYRTRYGARTIDDAIYVEALYHSRLVSLAKTTDSRPVYDNYANAEDSFIEQNGFSSQLY